MKEIQTVEGVAIRIGNDTGPVVLKSIKGPNGRLARHRNPEEINFKRRKINFTLCQHIVGATTESVKITKPKGCGGCSQTETTIWECSLRGDCAPLAIGIVADKEVLDCRLCKDYQNRNENES